MVAAAGPIANVVLATASAVVYRALFGEFASWLLF
jgi:hypothetical protein